MQLILQVFIIIVSIVRRKTNIFNASWACPCLSVCPSVSVTISRHLRTRDREPLGIPQGTKRIQGSTLQGSLLHWRFPPYVFTPARCFLPWPVPRSACLGNTGTPPPVEVGHLREPPPGDAPPRAVRLGTFPLCLFATRSMRGGTTLGASPPRGWSLEVA
jgi:hypothetical protein